MAESIYQQIADNISGGVLDRNFSPVEEGDDQTSTMFAPGAMDGICMYHMRPEALDEEGRAQMAAALKAAAERSCQTADALFYEWAKEHRVISHIDDLQKYVIDHAGELDPGNVHYTALSLILYSCHIECVKTGLSLLELFREPAEDLKEIIRLLGLSDEFTVFSLWNMHNWEKGNEEIFSLAKKVHGWGRIHAVEQLEPETEEIRHWLLTEGTVNDVVHAYSSLTCWIKSGAQEVLFGHPAEEEWEGLNTLIKGLLDEGPVPGISQLDNAKTVLLRFLELAPGYPVTAGIKDTVQSIREWARQGGEAFSSVVKACDRIR